MRLLYTANLQGDLALLPRLYTFIKTLRGEFEPDYLIDLGGACAPHVWHCAATSGRSMLIALDGMGYHVIHAGALRPDLFSKLAEQVTAALVNAAHPHQDAAVTFTAAPSPFVSVTQTTPLHVSLLPTTQTQRIGRVIHLQRTQGAQVGIVQIADDGLLSAEVREMPPDTAPDPTIAGVVDFVEAEARYYQRKTGNP